MLNTVVFQNILDSGKKILLVTKYWDTEKTLKIYTEAQNKYAQCLYGLGENRIEKIQEKNIPREDVHFIGNIQSQKITSIVTSCNTIHSLQKFSHALKIERCETHINVFIQIQLDKNKDIGISEDQLKSFIDDCSSLQYVHIIGISGMGSGECSTQEKRDEFQKLISLRDTYLPNGLISAGTSRDYELALEAGIDIVRVGSSAVM